VDAGRKKFRVGQDRSGEVPAGLGILRLNEVRWGWPVVVFEKGCAEKYFGVGGKVEEVG
jgi:hypothetical protein